MSWVHVEGKLCRIDVDPYNCPWGVNRQNEIYRWDPKNLCWLKMPGEATDIGIGSTWGTVWIVNASNNNNVYRLDGYKK